MSYKWSRFNSFWPFHNDTPRLFCLTLGPTRDYTSLYPQSPTRKPEKWTLSLSCEVLDGYAFHMTSLIADVMNNILSHDSWRIIVMAPGWPDILWFPDLVSLSSNIPFCLPNRADLLAQPASINQHNLSLHH